jgi:hypothetical protein
MNAFSQPGEEPRNMLEKQPEEPEQRLAVQQPR